MWHIFRRLEATVKITTFTTHFTTHLPSKNHVLHPVFCKTPCNNTLFRPDKKIRDSNTSGRQISLWKKLIRLGSPAVQRLATLPQSLPGRLTPPLPTPAQCEQDSGAAPWSHGPAPGYASELPDKSRDASPRTP